MSCGFFSLSIIKDFLLKIVNFLKAKKKENMSLWTILIILEVKFYYIFVTDILFILCYLSSIPTHLLLHAYIYMIFVGILYMYV